MSIPVTLIVATTPSMGIGRMGTLPWPSLRKEMTYFSRVTRRVPLGKVNAVVMGRKTWESIPHKFRPLKDRLNLIISREPEKIGLRVLTAEEEWAAESNVPLASKSFQDAITSLQKMQGAGEGPVTIHKVFVIGGAEIYKQALDLPKGTTLLRTRIAQEFVCDAFFPIVLGQSPDWKKMSQLDLDECTGEDVPAGLQGENDVDWEFELWEKIS